MSECGEDEDEKRDERVDVAASGEKKKW